MQGVNTLWRLASCTNIKAWRGFNVHMLIWAFCHSSTNYSEVFFVFRTWGMGVNKRTPTWL